jgi:hypothetical protein
MVREQKIKYHCYKLAGLLSRVIIPVARTTQTQKKSTKALMSRAGFEPTILILERVKHFMPQTEWPLGYIGNSRQTNKQTK